MLLDVTPYTEPLARTPSVLRAVIDGRPDAWLDSRHAPDVVSPREAVAHLLLTDRDYGWVDRVRLVLDPDHVVPPSDDISEADLLKTHSVQDLLDEFETVRVQRIKELEDLRLSAGDLEKQRSHSEFGPYTLGQLLATWVAHDLYHLGQIFKSYSALYVDQIGPWNHYLNLPHFN